MMLKASFKSSVVIATEIAILMLGCQSDISSTLNRLATVRQTPCCAHCDQKTHFYSTI